MVEERDYFKKLNLSLRIILTLFSAVSGGILIVVFVVGLTYFIFETLDEFDIINSSSRFSFPARGLIIFFFGAWYFGKNTRKYYNAFTKKIRTDQFFRYIVLLFIFYAIGLGSFIEFFQPNPFRYGMEFLFDSWFDQRWRIDDRISLFFKILLYPIMLYALGAFLYSKAKVKNLDDD